MSRTLLKNIKLCTNKYSSVLLNNVQHPSRLFSNRDNDGHDTTKNDLRHTTILIQHGTDFQELPVIVRKIDQEQLIAFCSNTVSDHNGSREFQVKPPRFNTEEVIKNINRCLTSNGVFSILESIPKDELLPAICVEALRKIAVIETILSMRNIEKSRVFEQLLDCIIQNGDNKAVLEAMEILQRHIDLSLSIDTICDELLRRNTEKCLSIEECCEAIHHFVYYKRTSSAEKFWLTLSDQEMLINAENIQLVYKVLPAFRVSRRVVLNVLEKRITGVWWQLKPESVVDILNSLTKCKITPFRTMLSLTRWTNTNIHAFDEETLTSVVNSYTQIDYTDLEIQKALERYVKAKGIKIKSQLLVVTILDHCRKFRLRNSHILNGCSEYFMLNAATFEPKYLKSLIQTFGTLDVEPLNNIKFWKCLEQYLNDNFDKITPVDVVETMINCVYLQKYPLNFVKRIFNPYFLDVLHTSNSPDKLQKLRSDLKLFDTSLTLECRDYDGPMLPRDHAAKSLWVDGRIRRMCNQINDHLSDLAGGDDRFMCGVVLHQLPINELYVVDVLLHPPGMSNLWSFNTRKERNVQTAILIHLPEHYCMAPAKDLLIGPQNMRHRHLRRLGMRVATFKYETLAKLRIHPKELSQYLKERIKEAEEAYPEFSE